MRNTTLHKVEQDLHTVLDHLRSPTGCLVFRVVQFLVFVCCICVLSFVLFFCHAIGWLRLTSLNVPLVSFISFNRNQFIKTLCFLSWLINQCYHLSLFCYLYNSIYLGDVVAIYRHSSLIVS